MADSISPDARIPSDHLSAPAKLFQDTKLAAKKKLSKAVESKIGSKRVRVRCLLLLCVTTTSHKLFLQEADVEDDVADDEEQYVGVLEDIDLPKRKTKVGRPVSSILDKVSQLCQDVKTKVRRYRCLGNRDGKNCKRSWACPRNRLRVLKHACHCSFLSAKLKAEANDLRSEESPGAILDKLESDAQARMGFNAQETDTQDVKRIRLESGADKNSNARPPALEVLVGETGRKLLQAQLDLAVVNLICAACLPPTLVDYSEWKNIFTIANKRYHTMSSTTLVDDHIPGQAARVRKLSIEYLKTQYDLTVSYDGATTKRPQSVYTVSFTTADGRSFLIEGNEASDESHTGEHIARILLAAMDLVGRLRFSGISGDSTGNTKVGRRLVCDVVCTIINMPDVCHHTSLGCKDIGRLPMFTDVCTSSCHIRLMALTLICRSSKTCV
jgi:hypothetical protein